jgi:hypothetical protein
MVRSVLIEFQHAMGGSVYVALLGLFWMHCQWPLCMHLPLFSALEPGTHERCLPFCILWPVESTGPAVVAIMVIISYIWRTCWEPPEAHWAQCRWLYRWQAAGCGVPAHHHNVQGGQQQVPQRHGLRARLLGIRQPAGAGHILPTIPLLIRLCNPGCHSLPHNTRSPGALSDVDSLDSMWNRLQEDPTAAVYGDCFQKPLETMLLGRQNVLTAFDLVGAQARWLH